MTIGHCTPGIFRRNIATHFFNNREKNNMNMSHTKTSLAVSLALIAASFSTQSGAAGFILLENSASGTGNANAGVAAIADNASTVWYNPAGMTKLSGNRVAVVGHVIMPKSDFENDGSVTAANSTLTGDGKDAGVTKFVPNFYYINQLNDDVTFGLGINAPFGLETDYSDDEWVGRYHSTHSEMTTININPALAFKVNDKLSIGMGLNYQLIDVTLENQLDPGAICIGLRMRALQEDQPTAGIACFTDGLTVQDSEEASQSLSGDDTSWGINFGVLYEFNETSRLGIAYRSGVNHDLEGDVDFTMTDDLMNFINTDLAIVGLTALFDDSAITAHTELPETLSFSYVHGLDDSITLLFDATLTRWSSFDELKIQFENPVQSDSVTPENWENTWRFAVGANYRSSDTLMYRFGLALDQSPVPSDEERTPRIPDNDRTWLSLGLNYAMNSDMSVDVGYAHLFVDDTDINNTDVSSGHILNGSYDSTVDILSAQLNMKF